MMWHFHQDNRGGRIYLVDPLTQTNLCYSRPGRKKEGNCIRLVVGNIQVVGSVDRDGKPRPGDQLTD